MKEVSKLLIAYDGSACSDAALKDLARAGLPMALEAVVLTVADIILPPPDEALAAEDLPAIRIPEVQRHAQAHARKAIEEARAFAERGANRVKEDFPGWNIKAEVRCDSPAWAVVKVADRDNPELIVVGSHGHAMVGGRLILGSVSQRVLYEARCSVRVARCSDARGKGPVRIVVGFSGSPDSEPAVTAVASRKWPEGSEARVITARDTKAPARHGVAAEILRAAGLSTSEVSRDGDPTHVLIKEAQAWGADSIFVGTRDVHGFRHFLQGSVSSAVAARAHCAVEVTRAAKGEQNFEEASASYVR
jgi:nucleotide-binding universal stress UspA family protein